jgi:hypothetical protein
MKIKLIGYLSFSFVFLTACMLLPLPGSTSKSPDLPQTITNPPATSAPVDQAPVEEPVEPTPSVAPTEPPTAAVPTATAAAPAKPTSLQLVVYGADEAVHMVPTLITLAAGNHPTLTGFLPSGGSANGTAYILSFRNGAAAAAVNANGNQALDFIKNPNYSLAVLPGAEGTQTWLAWGTTPLGESEPSVLQISRADGTQLDTLVTDDTGPARPTQLVAQFWSADGQSVYYSKEPYGIGGMIAFNGATSLYNVDIKTKKVTELIPLGGDGSPMLCLDAISTDLRFIADHCTRGKISIRDLSKTNAPQIILPPAGASGFDFIGGARFSADGKMVAFGLASGDMTNMQGWLAISDRSGEESKLILSAPAGQYYTIAGWLDDQTLLVESHDIQCSPTCNNAVYTLRTDGTMLTKLVDGSLLAVVETH